jgi:tetraacyldisaccharide 4'-kinase
VEIVLISAVAPWGFDHLLPRGLLREPLAGLSRAHALVITHAGEVAPKDLAAVESVVRNYNATAPIVFADHKLISLIAADGTEQPLLALPDGYWVACGIGQPESFLASLQATGKQCAGHGFFPDHHAYTYEDVITLRKQAAELSVSAIVVTEKDWAKLSRLPQASAGGIPFMRAKMEIAFAQYGEQKLLELICQRSRRT